MADWFDESLLDDEQALGRADAVLRPMAVVVLEFLSQVDLGPHTDPEEVARALDEVAVTCSPHRDLAVNPAKMLAIALADTNPIVWGGSVLAARAARRIAESIRRASGRTALAGDAEHLLPVIASTPLHDVFDDPFADSDGEPALRPALVVLDDGSDEPTVREHRGRLTAEATARRVRVETLTSPTVAVASSGIAGYASLLGQGRYAAAYLGVGLGRLGS